tara:strand:+ start:622 stop:1056 length:435 start_codon:yes stop_codon:yes gene_type:complete
MSISRGLITLLIVISVQACANNPKNVSESIIISAAKLDYADSVVFDLKERDLISDSKAMDIHLKILGAFDLLAASNAGYQEYREAKQEHESKCVASRSENVSRCEVIDKSLITSFRRGVENINLAQSVFNAVVDSLPAKYKKGF